MCVVWHAHTLACTASKTEVTLVNFTLTGYKERKVKQQKTKDPNFIQFKLIEENLAEVHFFDSFITFSSIHIWHFM